MRQIKWFGWLGLLAMLVAAIAVALGSAWFARYFTPVAWTGYILLADAIVLQFRENSLITRSPRTFIMLLWISVLCWLLFEIYNFKLKNWFYVNLPSNMVERNFGYIWAFATIIPGILESADLFEVIGLFRKQASKPTHHWGSFWLALSMVVGLAFVIIPPMLPDPATRYTFGFVWLGFFFLLDPLNYRMGTPSLLREWELGNRRKTYLLLAGGALCGLLWEGWNFYTLQFGGSGWIYALPYPLNVLQDVFSIGQMPLLGFLGFPPFALECWAMWQLLKALLLPGELDRTRNANRMSVSAAASD